MTIETINDLMLVSIQIIGIFIAIIGGLVASKLLSMRAEKEELIDKIKTLEKKKKHNQRDLDNKIAKNYEIYRENEYDLIIDSIIYDDKDYEYDTFEYYDPYITEETRKKFVDKVCDIITKLTDQKYDNMSSTDIAKDLGYDKRDFEYKIVNYYIDNKKYVNY